jgi:membrane associated rhomboid family serine protease
MIDNGLIDSVLMMLGLVLPVLAGVTWLADQPELGAGRIPYVTIAALLIVGVPTLIQLTVYPDLLFAWQRDADAIAAGDWWRMGTALVVQDGLLVGAITNLVSLAIIGWIAERIYGHVGWIVLAAAGAAIGELVGLVEQPIGAGNSVAVFGLGAGLTLIALARPHNERSRAFALGAAVVYVALLFIGDIHGAAASAGVLAAAGRLVALSRRETAGEASGRT